MKQFFIKWYPAILILIMSLALRLFLLFWYKSDFNFDENFSLHFSSLPWHEAIKYWVLETNPPLHTFLLRFWTMLFGASEISARLMSMLFGACSLILLYHLANKFFSRRTAIMATLLFSFSALNIFVDQESRTYSLLIFLSLLSSYFFIKINKEEKVEQKTWIYYCLSQTFLLYTHLTALLVPFIQLLLTFFDQNCDKLKKKKIIIYNLATLVLYAFWFLPSLWSKFNFRTISNGWYFNGHPANFLLGLVNLFTRPDTSTLVYLWLITLFAITIWQIFVVIKKNVNQQKIIAYLLTLAVLPIIMSSFLGILNAKYFCISLAPFALLLGLGIATYKNKKIGIIIFLLIFFTIIFSALSFLSHPNYRVQNITNYIKNNETKNSLILVMPFGEELTLKKYYQGTKPIVGAYPFNDNLPEDERIVRFNWFRLTIDEEQLGQWLQKITLGKDKIFYYSYGAPQDLPYKWLVTNGWQKINTVETEGNIKQYLFEFIPGTTTAKD